jgi:hypothetical protein
MGSCRAVSHAIQERYIGTDILYDTGEIVNALPYRADAYNDPRMPLMHEIRHDGVDL